MRVTDTLWLTKPLMKLRHSAGKVPAGGAPFRNSFRSCSCGLASPDDASSNAATALASVGTGVDWTAVGDAAADEEASGDADSATDPADDLSTESDLGAESAVDPGAESAVDAGAEGTGMLRVKSALAAGGEGVFCETLPACWTADLASAAFEGEEAGDAFCTCPDPALQTWLVFGERIWVGIVCHGDIVLLGT